MAKWIDLEWITMALKAAGHGLGGARLHSKISQHVTSGDDVQLLRLLGKQPPKVLDVDSLQNHLAGRWLLVGPDMSYAILPDSPPIVATGIETAGALEQILSRPDTIDQPRYYCPEHKYNPPPNSGMAFCPACEFPEMDESDRELAEWVDAHYVNVGIIRDEDGQLRPINNREMSAWRQWKRKRAKNDRPIN